MRPMIPACPGRADPPRSAHRSAVGKVVSSRRWRGLLAGLGLFAAPLRAQEATPAPAPPVEAPQPPSAPVDRGRYPPPERAFVVFVPTFRPAAGATPSPAAPDAPPPAEAPPPAPTPSDDAQPADPAPAPADPFAAALGAEVAAALHAVGRYHVLELRDLAPLTNLTAQQVWDGCTDDLGCVTLLGDRARARVGVLGTVAGADGSTLHVEVRLVDLDYGDEIEGLRLDLPWGPPPAPPEGEAPPAPTVGETAAAITLALDARLLPLWAAASAAPEATPAEVLPATTSTDAPPPAAELDTQLDRLAARASEGGNGRYWRSDTRGIQIDEDERDLLGLDPDDYLRFKRAGWTEEEWRERQKGHVGRVSVNVGGGFTSGETAQIYDGLVLLGGSASEIVEKYARLLPAPGAGPAAQLGVAVGVLPDFELELRGEVTTATSTVRTLQTFADRYPCVSGPECPKVESVSTRMFRAEALVRYQLRRPWLVRPYASAGVGYARFQDVVAAYNELSAFDFPAGYDQLPPLWSLGVTGAAGVSYELDEQARIFVEVPVYLRLVAGVYDPLHFYAATPEIEEPSAPLLLPFITGARVGLRLYFN